MKRFAPAVRLGQVYVVNAPGTERSVATIGFEELSRLTKLPAKSLMRMLGPQGNPQARNLFEVIGHLQRAEGLHFDVSSASD